MTIPPIERYGGREQAYVKHYFLAAYLERLIHKVGSRYDQIVYVDGFSGPWQSEGEDYDDTSFGIALRALRTAKASWQKLGRNVAMKAVLVEKNKSSHAALTTLQPRYPDVIIQPIQGDFRLLISDILVAIPQNAFAFVLIDPKGWSIPIDQIAQLLKRPNTEVVFNFMFDFINRAASMSTPAIVQGLDELLPIGDWRAELAAIDEQLTSTSRPAARRQVLLGAFRHVLRERGGYRYVAETPVFRPHLDRTLYSLVYASRSPTGIAVFASVKSLLFGSKKQFVELLRLPEPPSRLVRRICSGPCKALAQTQRQSTYPPNYGRLSSLCFRWRLMLVLASSGGMHGLRCCQCMLCYPPS